MTPAGSTEPVKGPPRVGSYRIIESLGTGGMSSVFRAVHEESGHEVAVKVLPRNLAKNPTLLQRFLREAKSAEALEHPNIASIYDRGFDGGRHYLVLEYVAGGDLHERVRNRGPLTVAEAVRSIREVAEGLRYASGQGVIHRDVKPANLLMTPAGCIKIIDLGLALQTENEDERVTRDGTTVGTVDYMSPEQARDSRATSERSDIYSLGCTFYFLLTGTPPFPGGDIIDKLGRHCTAPIPDAKSARPEISVDLNLLIKRMMAKKPEGRFSGYDALIAAIVALPEAGSATGGIATMDALFADDEEDSDGIPLVPQPNDEPPRQPIPRLPKQSPPRIDQAPLEVSLAELAGIESDAPATRQVRTKSVEPLAAPHEQHEEADAGEETSYRGGGPDLPLKTWVAAGAILGLAIALVGYGALQLLGTPSSVDVVNSESPDAEGPPTALPEPEISVPLRPISKPTNSTTPQANIPAKTISPTGPPWVEPVDLVAVPAPEPVIGPGIESAYLSTGGRSPIVAADAPIVVLRRAGETADVATMRQAFDKNPAVVEIADDGPFFEDDWRVGTKTRVIRARAGYRPMIRVDASNLAIVRDRPAVMTLDGGELTLEGLDLIVDVRDLSPAKSSLFVLKGAGLTLNRCTITVLNAAGRSFSLARIEAPSDERSGRASTVRLDRTFVRGTSTSMFDLAAGGEVSVNRSVVLHGSGAVVLERPSTERGDRRASFVRSVVASRGAAIEVPGSGAVTLQARSLATYFVKVAGVDGSGLIRTRNDPVGPIGTVIAWQGEGNTYLGWAAWMTMGERPMAILPGPASADPFWRSVDAGRAEARRYWPASTPDDATPTSLRDYPDAPACILDRVASPSPALLPSAIGRFAKQTLPLLAARPGVQRGGVGIPGVTASLPVVSFPPARVEQKSEISTSGASSTLTFSVNDPAYRGDLGRFLQSKITVSTPVVAVTIEGEGVWAMSPVRLPDGATVSIRSKGADGRAPTFYPTAGASAPALIALTRGDLALEGFNLSNSSAARVARLVAVEDGTLFIGRCSLQSTLATASIGSGLIGFRATGTRPFPKPRTGPFLSLVDRPTCVIADSVLRGGAGEAVGADLGRGVIGLVNCVVISEGEGAAFALRPQLVAAARFEADIILDHSTVVAEGDIVRIDAWPGAVPGPSRPWIVSSDRCAFVEVARPGRRSTVLLRSLRDGLAHGAMSWQASGDGYDLVHFLASGDAPPAPSRGRPDVKARWIDVWGPRHVVDVLGPNPRRTEPVLTIPGRNRLRAGNVTVDALALDAKVHNDLGANLDLIPNAALGNRPMPGFRPIQTP